MQGAQIGGGVAGGKCSRLEISEALDALDGYRNARHGAGVFFLPFAATRAYPHRSYRRQAMNGSEFAVARRGVSGHEQRGQAPCGKVVPAGTGGAFRLRFATLGFGECRSMRRVPRQVGKLAQPANRRPSARENLSCITPPHCGQLYPFTMTGSTRAAATGPGDQC